MNAQVCFVLEGINFEARRLVLMNVPKSYHKLLSVHQGASQALTGREKLPRWTLSYVVDQIGLFHLPGLKLYHPPCIHRRKSQLLPTLTLISQSLSSVVTPRSPVPSPSSRLPSPPTPPSHGTSPVTMPTLSVVCTFTPLATTPTAALPPVPTVCI